MSSFTSKVLGIASVALVAGVGLGACTTVEGTNALSDIGTFEREVAINTLEGLGIVPQKTKEPIKTPRAPLVLPKDGQSLPTPQEQKLASLLPEDSDKVQIDASNLTEEEIKRLRNARVVDLTTQSGRPLTEAETRKLTARMTAERIKAGKTKRPLYLPPEHYYTVTTSGQDLVCLAANGDLVKLDDPTCPPEIRAALAGN